MSIQTNFPHSRQQCIFLSMRSKWEDFILFFFRFEAYSSTNTIAIQKPIARIDRSRAFESGYMLESGIGSIYAELCTSACFGTEPSGYGPKKTIHNQIFTKSPKNGLIAQFDAKLKTDINNVRSENVHFRIFITKIGIKVKKIRKMSLWDILGKGLIT